VTRASAEWRSRPAGRANESRVVGRRCVQTGSEESRDQGDEKDSTTEDTETPRGKKKTKKTKAKVRVAGVAARKNSRKINPRSSPVRSSAAGSPSCGARFALGV